MTVKTTVGGADPQAYAYVANTFAKATESLGVNGQIIDFIKGVERATTALHSLLEEYYLSEEAERRWEDDGGACA